MGNGGKSVGVLGKKQKTFSFQMFRLISMRFFGLIQLCYDYERARQEPTFSGWKSLKIERKWMLDDAIEPLV